MTTLTELTKGVSVRSFEEAIRTAYRPSELQLAPRFPSGVHCNNPNAWIEGDKPTLSYPDGWLGGQFSTRSSTTVLHVESARSRWNCNPAFIIKCETESWGGYCILRYQRYYLFSRNEDNSFFLHPLYPPAAREGFEAMRKWMWEVRPDETLVARQGDLGLIDGNYRRMPGRLSLDTDAMLGNHLIDAEKLSRSANGRLYALNPVICHHEHPTVRREGIYELRLARRWREYEGD